MRGFTLVELVVALSISAVLSTVLYQMLAQGRRIGERVGAVSTSGQDVRLKVKRMTIEIQEGTRLFYPRPTATADGVGLVNARGETILYFVSPGASSAPELRRANLNTPREPPELLIKGVRHFRVTTAATSRGRSPGRVNLDLAVAASADQGETNVITEVFLRGLERYVPEDTTHEPIGVKREGEGAP